ncbi:hypothetical protein F8568_017645 [Actinomadura sp. LD22]|uniref:Uncharacterized protein n=1 Tax=Actinomadura physcomitrii TaxID=2650748 RepID=A0A6I4MCI8_9ACTN|nr:hypothetical protein [Actinomadura physcomitrii]MWA02165.1 hypothetical protein [Actinomadura physcomitrii]
MTAIVPEPNVQALADELMMLFAAHGVPVSLPDVRTIWQGGKLAGVTVTAYRRPDGLPAPMTRDQYDAHIRGEEL